MDIKFVAVAAVNKSLVAQSAPLNVLSCGYLSHKNKKQGTNGWGWNRITMNVHLIKFIVGSNALN